MFSLASSLLSRVTSSYSPANVDSKPVPKPQGARLPSGNISFQAICFNLLLWGAKLVGGQTPVFSNTFLGQVSGGLNTGAGDSLFIDLKGAADGQGFPVIYSVEAPSWLTFNLNPMTLVGQIPNAGGTFAPQGGAVRMTDTHTIVLSSFTSFTSYDTASQGEVDQVQQVTPGTVSYFDLGGHVLGAVFSSPSSQGAFFNISSDGSFGLRSNFTGNYTFITMAPDGLSAHVVSDSPLFRYSLVNLTQFDLPVVGTPLNTPTPAAPAIETDFTCLGTNGGNVIVVDRSNPNNLTIVNTILGAGFDARARAEEIFTFSAATTAVNEYQIAGDGAATQLGQVFLNSNPLQLYVRGPIIGSIANSQLSLYDASQNAPNISLVENVDIRTLLSNNSLQISGVAFDSRNRAALTVAQGPLLFFDLFASNLTGIPQGSDVGTYMVTISASNGMGRAMVTFPVSVSGTRGSSGQHSSNATPAIIGGVVGGIGGCTILCGLGGAFAYLYRRSSGSVQKGIELGETSPRRKIRRLKGQGELLKGRFLEIGLTDEDRKDIYLQTGKSMPSTRMSGVLGEGAHGKVVIIADLEDKPLSEDLPPREEAPYYRAAKRVEGKGIEPSRKEGHFWAKVQDDNVVRLIASIEQNDLLYHVMELYAYDGSEGLSLIASVQNPASKELLLTGALFDVLKGLKAIHKVGSHADLKADNMGVRKGGTFIIGDFGRSVEARYLKREDIGSWTGYSYRRLYSHFNEGSCDGHQDDAFAAALAITMGWTGQVPTTAFGVPTTRLAYYQAGRGFIQKQINSLPALEFLRSPKEGTLFSVIRGLLLGQLVVDEALKAPCFTQFDENQRRSVWEKVVQAALTQPEPEALIERVAPPTPTSQEVVLYLNEEPSSDLYQNDPPKLNVTRPVETRPMQDDYQTND